MDSTASADPCDFCGLVWTECRCEPKVPHESISEMVGPEPVILIDQREQSPLRFRGTRWEKCFLPVGDYSLRGLTAEVVIERKSLSDLVGCCGKERERFIAQVERMRDYRFRALVVEARLTDIQIGAYRSQMNPLSVVGTLVKVAHELNVPVWMAEDDRGATELVERMLLREYKLARKAK